MQDFSAETAERPESPATTTTTDTDDGAPGAQVDTDALTLTVVVCAYTLDRWEVMSASLQSLRDQVRPAQQVVLVTDHNTELHRRAAEAFPDIEVVASEGRPGLSGARNTGIARARGDIVAFLDDDAVADTDWTAELMAGYADPAVLGVGGGIEPYWEAGRPGWFPREFDWVVGCSYTGLPEQPAPIRNMIGANMSLRREAFDAVGGFSSDLGRTGSLPLGCEETELCIRVGHRYQDGVILYRPDAVVHHHVGAVRGSWRYFASRCWREGQSKAAVSRMAGARAALSSERTYLRSTIPRAVGRALRPGGGTPPLRTLAAICLGVLLTGLGYLTGTARTVTRRQLARQLVVALPLTAALALWGYSVPTTRAGVGDLGGFGLAAVLPWSFWTALGLLVLGFTVALHRPSRSALWPGCYTVALLLLQRATQALVYPGPLYSWAWKHIDIIDRLSANGGHLDLSNRLAAMAPYDQWAGFFAGNTALVKLLGLNGALSYAAWAPFVSSLLLLVPLVLLLQVFSRDRRLVWTAVWIFYLGNWVGQDYFSPQAFAFVLYLGVLALALRNLARTAPPGRHGAADDGYPLGSPPRAQLPRRERLVWLLLLVLPVAAVAMSHQLTPVVLAVGLMVLLLTRRYRNWWLVALALLIPAAWDATSALSFFRLQLPAMEQTFGNLLANSQAGYGTTPTGTGPVIVSWMDRGLSGAVAGLAVVGVLRHPSLRRTALPLILVAVAPMPLVVANSYGGEMIFRVFMFALPGLSFFAAAALRRRPEPVARTDDGAPAAVAAPASEWRPGRARPLLAAAVTLTVLGLLAAVFVPSYTGKDRLAYFPRAEVDLVDAMIAQAPPGSYIVAPDSNFPDAYAGYDHYAHWWLADDTGTPLSSLLADPAGYIARGMAWTGPDGHAYLLFSRAQESDVTMQRLLPPGSYARIEASVAASPSFRLILQNSDGKVYAYLPTGAVNG